MRGDEPLFLVMEEYNVNKGINRKALEDAVKEIFREDKKEVRRFQGFRGCIVYGAINLSDMTTCDNPECTSCQMMKKSWDKVVKEFLDGKKEKDL